MNPLELAANRSPWARVNVGEKAFLLFGLLALAISLPPLPALPLIFLVILAVAFVARVPWKLYGALVSAPATFIALGLAPLIVALSPHGFVLIPGGMANALTVLSRSVVGMSATMLFALTTPMGELLAFGSSLKIPSSLLQLTALIYRLTSTLVSTARSMWDAQAARLGHSNTRRWIRSTADQAATLFVLSFSRARALEAGLELRADPASLLTLQPARPVRWPVVCVSAAALVAICIVSFFGAGRLL